ncbi:MAG: hypothetical protein ACRC46_05525 [Thermoguttaceae bacterium]
MTPQPPDDTPLSVLVIDDDVSHAEVVAEALAFIPSEFAVAFQSSSIFQSFSISPTLFL